MPAPPYKAPLPHSGGAPRADASLAFAPLSSDLLGIGVLSAVAGYVDASGFLGLFGLFTAHVTGDLVAAGAVVASHARVGAGVRIATVPVFMLSVVVASLVARAARRRGSRPLTVLLGLMTIALAAFCFTGVALRPFLSGPHAWAVLVTGATGVIAMGIQNALMRDVLSGSSPTTIMTGNLTQLTMDLLEVALPTRGVEAKPDSSANRNEVSRRLVKFGTPFIGFMSGTVLGGAITAAVGLWSIVLPTVTVGALTVIMWRHARVEERIANRARPAPSLVATVSAAATVANVSSVAASGVAAT